MFAMLLFTSNQVACDFIIFGDSVVQYLFAPDIVTCLLYAVGLYYHLLLLVLVLLLVSE